MSWEDVKKELESDEYKTEYARSVDILNSLIRPLMFIKVNCNIHKSFTGTLFFKFIIDDLIHSLIGLKVLLDIRISSKGLFGFSKIFKREL